MGMKAMGRPYFVAPDVPKDRADALRAAFMETMQNPDFLADAEKALGAIDPLSGAGMQKLIANVYTLPPAILAKARETVRAPGAD
jgi:tripartite-type tricarboxylate transporter receptor subunit TctC